jgi:hypothetical protein
LVGRRLFLAGLRRTLILRRFRTGLGERGRLDSFRAPNAHGPCQGKDERKRERGEQSAHGRKPFRRVSTVHYGKVR